MHLRSISSQLLAGAAVAGRLGADVSGLQRRAAGDVLETRLLGIPEQVGAARDFARVLLVDHPLVPDILVMISELFANAVRHTASGNPGGLVVLEIRRWRRGVAVIDQGGPSEPVVRTVEETLDALSEGGRGLLTVEAYASWWRWRGDERSRTMTAFFWE